MKLLFRRFLRLTGIPEYWARNSLTELKMAWLRIITISPLLRAKIRQLTKSGDTCIIFGCGKTRHEGWIHIDCFKSENVDIALDLRRRIPFQNSSVIRCYSEHFVEHLTPKEVILHLEDVYRVLAPNGIYRMVVPDAGKFMEKYAAGDLEFFRLAHPWEKHPIDAVYSIFNWGGDHRSIFDFESIVRLASQAGFAYVVRSSANGSSNQELNIDSLGESRQLESIYVELVKGDAP